MMERDGDFINEGMFGIADAPWLPTLLDIIANEDPYYRKFGFGQLEVPEDCPRVSVLMGWMETMFNERYAYRYINKETLEQWQTSLQSNFDRRVHTLENSLMLYDRHKERMAEVFHIDRVTRNVNATSDRTTNLSGTDTVDSNITDLVTGDSMTTNDTTTTGSDSPDSQVNLNNQYNNSVTKVDGNVTEVHTENVSTDRKDNGTITRDTIDKKTDGVLEITEHDTVDDPARQIDEAVRMWRDLGSEFVTGFENNFLNILWC